MPKVFRDAFNRHVLLTGATGFLGGELLAQGLTNGFAGRWTCIARGETELQAKDRVLENLSRYVSSETVELASQVVEVVPGDITSAATFEDPRLNDISHIFHLAADTSYRSKSVNRLVNVEGTRNVAELAIRQATLEKFVYSGTAMICGRNSSHLVNEADYPDEAAEHVVHYTATKADAERMIRSHYKELPFLIVRPSIVAGHSRLGARPSASIFWMFRAGDHLRVVSGNPDGGIDVVPVDWVATTILDLATRERLQHDTYHLSASLTKRTTWRSLAAAFERVEPSDGIRAYREISPGEWRQLRACFDKSFGLETSLKVAMLRAMRAYYEFCALDVAFCNKRLLSEGISPPPSLPDYLRTCIESMPDVSIEAQFADDLGMFEPVEMTQRLRSQALSPV